MMLANDVLTLGTAVPATLVADLAVNSMLES
jgi:hypothetical protein